jgi:hypothetical protein
MQCKQARLIHGLQIWRSTAGEKQQHWYVPGLHREFSLPFPSLIKYFQPAGAYILENTPGGGISFKYEKGKRKSGKMEKKKEEREKKKKKREKKKKKRERKLEKGKKKGKINAK